MIPMPMPMAIPMSTMIRINNYATTCANTKKFQRDNRKISFSSSSLWKCVVCLCLILLSHSVQGMPLQDENDNVNERNDVDDNNDNDNNETIRVIVSFDTEDDQESYWKESTDTLDDIFDENIFQKYSSMSTTTTTTTRRRKRPKDVYRFQRSKTIAMTIPKWQWKEIEQDTRVSHMQSDDTIMQLYQTADEARMNEILPYGIQAVQGTSNFDIPPPQFMESTMNCQDPNSFKVCIVDSGLLVQHSDIPFLRSESNIQGQGFGLSSDVDWYNPSAASSHGTHVTGTIIAQAKNGFGVVGVVPNADGMCLLVARTFDDIGAQYSSVITQGVEWCASQGARVINMSLGSSTATQQSEMDIYNRIINDENVLIVAAAGNLGDDSLSYPASLDSVLSVAAVDESFDRAPFSQFNNQVDIAAPGVNILSTTSANAVRLNNALQELIEAALMQFSPDTPDGLLQMELELTDCQQGFQACSDGRNKVCLIERGETFFWEKALSCQQGQGVAAFIYNNLPGAYGGSLSSDETGVTIPVYAITREDGLLLLQEEASSTTVTLQPASASYGFLDGTSMATPHVTGVATKIWAARPQCTNFQIREALTQSALDLGPPGRDDAFGFGLVQAEAAYNYLETQFDPPCGGPLQDDTNDNNDDNNNTNDPPPRNCVENFSSCELDADCCSRRCVPTTIGGPRVCRTTPKASKNKIAGELSRGGAAARGDRRQRRQRRGLRGDATAANYPDELSSNHQQHQEQQHQRQKNVSSESNIELQETNEDDFVTARDLYDNENRRSGQQAPFQDLHSPFTRNHHRNSHPQKATYDETWEGRATK